MAKPQNIEQRNSILKTALQLFLEKGYDETTTREIAQYCGIDRGLLYYYYNKKSDILYNIYSSYLNILKDFIDTKFENQQPEIKIALLTRLFFQTIFKKTKYLGILQNILENQELINYKIELTSSIFYQFMGNTSSTKNKVKISTTSAVAAESQLLLGLIKGNLSIDKSIIEEQIIKIEFNCLNFSSDDIKDILLKSERLIESLDLNLFYNHLKENIIWL